MRTFPIVADKYRTSSVVFGITLPSSLLNDPSHMLRVRRVADIPWKC